MKGYSPRYISILFGILLSNMLIAPSIAQQKEPMLDRNKLSIGGGISDNSVGRVDETGFQVFAAYDLDQVNVMEGVQSSLEFGVMDYGFRRDSTGIWGNYVIEGGINQSINWLARVGLDIGDDSGLMFGAGLGFGLNEQVDFRIEYVIRDDVDSLQFNLLFEL